MLKSNDNSCLTTTLWYTLPFRSGAGGDAFAADAGVSLEASVSIGAGSSSCSSSWSLSPPPPPCAAAVRDASSAASRRGTNSFFRPLASSPRFLSSVRSAAQVILGGSSKAACGTGEGDPLASSGRGAATRLLRRDAGVLAEESASASAASAGGGFADRLRLVLGMVSLAPRGIGGLQISWRAILLKNVVLFLSGFRFQLH